MIGLSPDESKGLLDELYAHAHREPFIYEHKWKTGDIVIWDNVGLQHMRPPIVPSKRRTLRVFQGVSEAWSLPRALLSASLAPAQAAE